MNENQIEEEQYEELLPEPQKRDPASLFDVFWAEYPIRVGKQGARRVWDRRVKGGTDPRKLIDGARRYAAWIREGGVESEKYVKHPKTWLHNGCEEDDLTPPELINGRLSPADEATRRWLTRHGGFEDEDQETASEATGSARIRPEPRSPVRHDVV